MNKNLNGILAIAIMLIASSCSSIKYYTDIDDSIDFTKYKTYQYYGWAEESNKILNQLEQQRIEKAFGGELAKRNVEFVEDNGDIVVTLYIVTEQKTKTTATTTHMGGAYSGYGYGYGGYGYGPAYGWGGGSSHTSYNEYDYVVGTLVISFYDAKEQRLIWESVAQGETHENPKGQEERVKKLAARMMKEYPIPAVDK